MNKTSIEWVKNPDGSQGYTWNPITGCLNNNNGLCRGGGFPCYAYKMANTRLADRYTANKNTASPNLGKTNLSPEAISDPFYPRFWEARLKELEPWGKLKYFTEDGLSKVQIKGIFVCDMGELFGDWVPRKWQDRVFETIKLHPNFRFYLLTKQPQNLIKFSPFPDNCWVGVTATNALRFHSACEHLFDIKAHTKFVSLEPLLEWQPWFEIKLPQHLNWLIIGACTGVGQKLYELTKRNSGLTLMRYCDRWTAQPKIEWVREIVEAANQADIPVFLKDNLKPLIGQNCTIDDKWVWAKDLGYGGLIRQEMPNCPK